MRNDNTKKQLRNGDKYSEVSETEWNTALDEEKGAAEARKNFEKMNCFAMNRFSKTM